MTEFHIGQRVRFRETFKRFSTAEGQRVGKLYPLADEVPDWLADAVAAGEPMKVVVDGYEYDEMEDTDVVIVTVQCGSRRIPDAWVHPGCLEPV